MKTITHIELSKADLDALDNVAYILEKISSDNACWTARDIRKLVSGDFSNVTRDWLKVTIEEEN